MHRFDKYEALGNDYLVLDPATWSMPLTPERIRRLCDRHFGLGSDGILRGPLPPPAASPATCGLRIFNPDGSEAEKSGNGLRIFARYLWDRRQVKTEPFQVVTAGGTVTCQVLPREQCIRIDMGQVRFHSRDIPVSGPEREVIREELTLGDIRLCFCAATVGNPHCVVLNQPATAETARKLGPLLETHPLFPNRTNVQFLDVLDRSAIRIEIWERGAGYTLASGSSASAAAAVARRLDLCDAAVRVLMPGGVLRVEIDTQFGITQTGPVRAVARGTASRDLLAALKAM